MNATPEQEKKALARQVWICRNHGIPGQVEFWESIYGESYDEYTARMVEEKKR